MYTLPEAPMELGGILDDGFRLFRASCRPLLPVAIAGSLLSTAPQLLLVGSADSEFGQWPDIAAIGSAAILAVLGMMLLSLVSCSVVLAGVDQAARSGTVSLAAALRTGLGRAPALVGASLLAALVLVIGFVPLIIPGLYLSVVLFPALLVPVIERLGPVASFARAWALVKGHWWRTAGVLTVMGIVVIALALAVSVIDGIAAAGLIWAGRAERYLPWIQVLVALLMAPLIPLSYCLMYACYTDLRLRKGGGDLSSGAAEACV